MPKDLLVPAQQNRFVQHQETYEGGNSLAAGEKQRVRVVDGGKQKSFSKPGIDTAV